MRTVAVRENGSWLINGSKNFITHASYADTCVVLAITDRAKGNHGVSAFVVPADTPGFIRGRKENKLGMRASDTAGLTFENLRIPAENLLGELNGGFVDSLKVLDGGRISIAALSLGIAQGAYESALRYAKERHSFGRPIAEFQAIQWKLADMATQIDAARLLTLRAAAMKNAGKKMTKESAMAKLYASEVAVKVSEEAIQIHGGYGYTKDYPAEKFWRDSKLCTIGEGTSEIQRLVIAREILRSH
jgi:alkylation response protein AidB-like acyl-CoA dehydrogenase